MLVVLVWVAFGQTLGYGFINYDDPEYITENPHVLNGLSGQNLIWAFTTGHTGYAHPVTWLTHQFDCQLFGVWAGGHHLTSLLIHTINTLLLFWLFWRVTRQPWPSAFIAAVFAVHPIHAESVAWVAERKDVLSGFFFLLTLHAYTSYAAKPKASNYLLVLTLFILGVLSKPMLVTAPCVLLLFDYWPLRRMALPPDKPSGNKLTLGRLIAEKVPLLVVAIVWSLITFSLQKGSGATAQAHLALGRRIANALFSYLMYLWNTVWPYEMALFYPYPRELPAAAMLVSIVLLVLMAVLCIVRLRSSPYLVTGWLWYVGMLAPVIGFIQVGEQSRADRYMYLPQIGLSILLAWGALELFGKSQRGRQTLATVAAVVALMLTILCHVQAGYWKDSETTWNHSLAVTTGNHIAHNNLGDVLIKKKQWNEAVEHLQKAIQIFPDYPEANNNLGFALASNGKWAEAVASYQTALKFRPNYPKARNNLGISLSEQGKTKEAIEQFNEAIRQDPDYADSHANLAIALLQAGRRDEAITQLRETLRLKPDDAEVRAQLRQLGVGP